MSYYIAETLGRVEAAGEWRVSDLLTWLVDWDYAYFYVQHHYQF